jgi:hypothetical protein
MKTKKDFLNRWHRVEQLKNIYVRKTGIELSYAPLLNLRSKYEIYWSRCDEKMHTIEKILNKRIDIEKSLIDRYEKWLDGFAFNYPVSGSNNWHKLTSFYHKYYAKLVAEWLKSIGFDAKIKTEDEFYWVLSKIDYIDFEILLRQDRVTEKIENGIDIESINPYIWIEISY